MKKHYANNPEKALKYFVKKGMKKYFPQWPYAARTEGSGYVNYVGKARWKTSGSGAIMRDPDGIQNMTANQVIKLLLGS